MLSSKQYLNFIQPRSLALIGLTSKTGLGSCNGLEVLQAAGYSGRVYPVNPGAKEILGCQAYASVLDLPEIPDLAVISTSREVVPEVLRQCARKKIKEVVIITQGFADGDARGKELQEEIINIARLNNIRIVGPNTIGIINNFNNLSTSFKNFINPPAPVGIICQSGIFLAAGAQFTGGIGLGIDIGNAVDVDFADVLDHFTRDDRLRIINLHVEGVTNGRRFAEAARKAVRRKPVLVLKTGRSEAGAKAASSHTGSLTGEDRVFEAACRQAGVIRVADVEEMRDLNKAFLTYPGLAGKRVGVITITGGGGITAVDALGAAGLEVASFSPGTVKKIGSMLPGWMHPGNPVDIWPASMTGSPGYPGVYRRTLQSLLDDPGVDAAICILGAYLHKEEDFLDITALLREVAAANPHKPVVVVPFGARTGAYAEALEQEGHIAAYPSAERAARALAALHYYYSRARHLKPDMFLAAGYQRSHSLNLDLPAGGGLLSCAESLALINSYGIPTAASVPARTREEAVAAADQIGCPVVLKISSRHISHKSDAGGVRLNLKNRLEVAAAYDAMLRDVRSRDKDAVVIVQPFVSGGTEVLLGCKKDPQFGPVLVCGSGGILTEHLNDVAFRLPPINLDGALAMLAETRAANLLKGYRHIPPADLRAVADSIVKLSRLALDHPEIEELDINPLVAGPDGVIALDARVMLGGPDPGQAGRDPEGLAKKMGVATS
ncbi:MAG: acetate--CoA ligase family protein [Bacillota bacterium]